MPQGDTLVITEEVEALQEDILVITGEARALDIGEATAEAPGIGEATAEALGAEAEVPGAEAPVL